MTSADFRKMALAMPDAVEKEHMDHPDFRVEGRIFATLHKDGLWGVVMLTPRQQAEFVKLAPNTFVPASGAWGRKGCTQVLLKRARKAALQKAIRLAWLNRSQS